MAKPDDENTYWLDKPGTADRLYKILLGIAGLLTLPALYDLMVTLFSKSDSFGIENIERFYGFYGAIGYVVLILVAILLRPLLKRDEDYYD